MPGSTHSPAARGVAATTGGGAASSGSGSGSSGMSMSIVDVVVELLVERRGVLGDHWVRALGGTCATTSVAPSGTITKGLPSHSDLEVRAVAVAAVRRARPTALSDTPVAIRIATSTTATRRTAAPAVPRPAWRGRPTTAPR